MNGPAVTRGLRLMLCLVTLLFGGPTIAHAEEDSAALVVLQHSEANEDASTSPETDAFISSFVN